MCQDGSLNHVPYWVPFTQQGPTTVPGITDKSFWDSRPHLTVGISLARKGAWRLRSCWFPAEVRCWNLGQLSTGTNLHTWETQQHKRFQTYISLSWDKLLQPKVLPTPQTSIPAPLGEEASWKWFHCAPVEMVSPLSRTETALRGHRDSGRNE